MLIIFAFFKTIFRFLFHAVAAAVRAVYRLLKAARLRLFAIYLVLCGVVQLIWQPFSGDGIVLFWLGVFVCVIVFAFGWIRAFRKENERRRREKEEAERKKEEKLAIKRARREERLQRKEEKRAARVPTPERRYPVYFEAADHPGYVFAEYEDRYELFFRRNGELVYIRTDKKEI